MGMRFCCQSDMPRKLPPLNPQFTVYPRTGPQDERATLRFLSKRAQKRRTRASVLSTGQKKTPRRGKPKMPGARILREEETEGKIGSR